MNARNGKIARLPRSVRNELNERLEPPSKAPNCSIGSTPCPR